MTMKKHRVGLRFAGMMSISLLIGLGSGILVGAGGGWIAAGLDWLGWALALAAPALMAMPAAASDRAGESLTPSPTIRTVCPSRRSRATYSALSAGRTPARNSSTPTWAAMAAAVR